MRKGPAGPSADDRPLRRSIVVLGPLGRSRVCAPRARWRSGEIEDTPGNAEVAEAFDEKTAKAWPFGSNARLDDEAPIDVMRAATEPEQFAEVRAGRCAVFLTARRRAGTRPV